MNQATERLNTRLTRIVELAAKNWIVFSVGRVIAYLAVGLVENACPAYESEITPAPLRGFVTGSLIMLVSRPTLRHGEVKDRI